MTAADRFTPAEIELARELALPREFREGDWYIVQVLWRSVEWSKPILVTSHTASHLRNQHTVWIPSVEDCLDLLEEAGHEDIDLRRSTAKDWYASVGLRWPIRKHGATPREALYRLLLVVLTVAFVGGGR